MAPTHFVVWICLRRAHRLPAVRFGSAVRRSSIWRSG